MKKIVLLSFLFVYHLYGISQINYGLGLFGIDSCKFETECSILRLDTSSSQIWQIAKPNKTIFDTAFVGEKALITDSANAYPVNNHSYFDLVFHTNSGYNVLVEFNHKYDTDTRRDGGYIEISTDKGLSWQQIDSFPIAGEAQIYNFENLYSEDDTLLNGIPAFSGNSNGWVHTKIQWIWALPVKRIEDTAMLRFHFISDSIETNQEGWMIDDIVVSTVDLGSGIDETVSNQVKMTLSPNPTVAQTRVSFERLQGNNHELRVYDSMGKLVEQHVRMDKQGLILQTENWKSGLYIIQLLTEGKVAAYQQLVVNN